MKNLWAYLPSLATVGFFVGEIAVICAIYNHLHSGVKRIDNGQGVEIVEHSIPFGIKKYIHKENGAELIVSGGTFGGKIVFYYDDNLDGRLDRVSNIDFNYKRGEPNTEELFRRADKTWEGYRTDLDVERVVGKELEKNFKPEDKFDF